MTLENQPVLASNREHLLKRRYTWLLWLVVVIIVISPRVFDLDVFYARDELAIWPWADEFALAVWDGNPAGTLTASDYPGIPMFWAQTLFLTVKYNFPSLFEQTMVPLEKLTEDRSLDLLAERRLVAALLVSLQIVAVVWLVRHLFGRWVAFLSAIFLGLDPFSLSEARLLRLEMVSALFACLGVLAYFFYLTRRQRSWLLLSGVMAGLGVASKTSAGLIVPYIWLLLLADFLCPQFFKFPISNLPSPIPNPPAWPHRLKRMIANGLVWAAGAIGAFWLIWPAMWVKPLEAIRYIFVQGLSQASEESVWHGEVFFWGQLFRDDPGPFFYPVVLAFRTTPLTWIGVASSLLFLAILILSSKFSIFNSQFSKLTTDKLRLPSSISNPSITVRTSSQSPVSNLQSFGFAQASSRGSARGDKSPIPNLWPAVAVILLLAYVVVITLELTFVISKVDRFLLLVFPALNILSAIGLATLIEWIRLTTRRESESSRLTPHASRFTPHASRLTPHATRNWLSAGLIVMILGLQLATTLPAHPYYFTYWNPWTGGGAAAMTTLPMGSGEGIDLAINYLNNQPDAVEAKLVCGASQPWCSRLFKGETLRSAAYFDGSWADADYATFYISHLQRQNYPPEIVDFFMQQTPLYKVELQGATYVWVYRVPEMAHFAGRANDLAGLARLLGYDVTPPLTAGVGSGRPIKATVWWINLGAGVDNLLLRIIDQTGYEWARTGVVPQPEYASIPADRRAVVAGTASLAMPPGMPPGPYFLRIGVLEPGGERLLAEFAMPAEADRLVVMPGQIFTDPNLFAIPDRVDRPLAPEMTLLGYARPDRVLTAEAPAWLTLYWQATAPPPDYLVQLRLLNRANAEVARWQGKPGYGYHPTGNWQPGEIVQDVWALQVKPETPVGRYNLEISLLNPDHPQIENRKSKIQNLEVWPQPISYEIPKMQAELQTNYGDKLKLLGYDLYFDTDGSGGGSFSPVLYWQSLTDFEESFDIVFTLRSATSDEVVDTWQVPLGSDGAKTFWKSGEVIQTIHQLAAKTFIGGDYHLEISVLDQTSGQLEPVNRSGTTFSRIEHIQDKIVVRIADQ